MPSDSVYLGDYRLLVRSLLQESRALILKIRKSSVLESVLAGEAYAER